MGALDVPDLTLYAAPVFLAALLIERVILRRQRAAGRAVVGYDDRADTWASLKMGIGSVFFVSALHVAIFALASALYPLRVVDPPAAASWAIAIVGWDFVYYWHHRIEHVVRIFWAAHVSHHSSRAFNFSTALRQPWTPVLGLSLFPLLALLGVRPDQILVAEGVNLVYQFWVHTEAIDRLPGPIEWLFNTPSHHRVHHGKNPEYIDKNYGGILIVWDRLFGSFEPEHAKVRYGITKDVGSDAVLTVAFHEYVALARELGRARSVREALRAVFGHPA